MADTDSTLIIPATDFGDTGRLTCGQGDDQEELYLWVEDPKHLFRQSAPMLIVSLRVRTKLD